MNKYNLLLIEDQTLVRQSLTSLINSTQQFCVTNVADCVQEAIKILSSTHKLDLILCDYNLKGHTAYDLLQNRSLQNLPPIILITSIFNAIELQRCLQLGAKGFLYKECDLNQLQQALLSVAEGGVYFASPSDHDADTHTSSIDDSTLRRLTEAEQETLTWLATGMSNKQIAITLGKSNETIKAHVSSILKKLNCKTRTHAVITAAKMNLI